MVMSLLESLYKSLYKNVKDPALSIFRSPWRPEKSCVFAAAGRRSVYSRVSPDPPGTNPLNLHQIEPGFLL